MSVTIIRCPNCGGDIDEDDDRCPYCNSDIVRDQKDVRKDMVYDMLKAARDDLFTKKIGECRSHIDDVLSIDRDCADAWYMSAALHSDDAVRYKEEKERASECTAEYGIFGASDLGSYLRKNKKEKKKRIGTVFLMVGIYILFFGGSISLGLGLGLGTLIPLYVTLGTLLVLAIVYFLVTLKYRRKE